MAQTVGERGGAVPDVSREGLGTGNRRRRHYQPTRRTGDLSARAVPDAFPMREAEREPSLTVGGRALAARESTPSGATGYRGELERAQPSS